MTLIVIALIALSIILTFKSYAEDTQLYLFGEAALEHSAADDPIQELKI